MIELFRNIDQGLTYIDKKVPFKMHQLASGSGGLQYKPVGEYHTLDHLARIMIQHSDNTATNIVLDEIGGSDKWLRYFKISFEKNHATF